MESEQATQIVKVKYFSETTGELSAREYTYYSEEPLKVGDVVTVPVRDTIGKANVSAIDVPEAEIEAFKDKVKTIPAGSVLDKTIEQMEQEADESLAASEKQWEAEAEAELAAQAEIDAEDQESHDLMELIKTNAVAIVKIGPEHDPAVLALAEEARKLRDYAAIRVIAADADLKPATEDLSIIATVKKSLAEKKSDYLKPIKAHVDAVNAAFNSITAPLDEADTLTRNKIKDYRAAAEKRRLEAEAINREKEELARREASFNGTGEITVDTTPVEAPAPINRVVTDLGTASTIKVRKWELVDFAALPDEYKTIDAGKVTKLVKAGIGSIPGIRIYEEESIRVNAR